MGVGGTSGPGVEGLAVLHHFSGRRIVVVVECNGSRCHEQSAQTATPPLTLVTAIKILENNKEGHGGRGGGHGGQVGGSEVFIVPSLRPRGQPMPTSEEDRRTVERTSPLKITAGRFLWRRRRMRRSKAANDGPRTRLSPLPLSSLRRRLPPRLLAAAVRGPQKTMALRATRSCMEGWLHP